MLFHSNTGVSKSTCTFMRLISSFVACNKLKLWFDLLQRLVQRKTVAHYLSSSRRRSAHSRVRAILKFPVPNKIPSSNRHRPLAGECLAAFTSAFPVAFLEPNLNKYNLFSIYNILSIKDRQRMPFSARSVRRP